MSVQNTSHNTILHEILKDKKIAVVHDWFFSRRGGEKVLEEILNILPQADLHLLFGTPEVLKLNKQPTRIFKSFLASLPGIQNYYKWCLPLLPMAAESLDMSEYDIIISSSHCVAKGIIPHPGAKHISYVHSPMRYAWDQERRYFKKAVTILRPLEILRRIILSRLRIWDCVSTTRIHQIVSNSSYVAKRCSLYYGRKSNVIYPPVDIARFQKSNASNASGSQSPTIIGNEVLLFGAWVPYKKMKRALELLIEQNIPVIAAGNGDEFSAAKKQYSANKNIQFFENPSDAQVAELYARSRILLFPGVEDFGIVPVEAQAAGLWVVAPNKGGTAETILPEVTGSLFQADSETEMIKTVHEALQKQGTKIVTEQIQNHLKQFSTSQFQESFAQAIINLVHHKHN